MVRSICKMSPMMIFEVLHGSKSNHLKLNGNMVSTLNEICNSRLKINFFEGKDWYKTSL